MFRECEHLRPVGFARAVDDHAGDAGLRARGEQLDLPSAKAVVLQMIVGVVETECHAGQTYSQPRHKATKEEKAWLLGSFVV